MKSWNLLFVALVGAFALHLGSGTAAAETLRVESADGSHALTLEGRFQLRYAYGIQQVGPNQDPTSSFFLRRLQPDVRGTAFDELLSFRLLLELNREASLRDGWVALRLNDTFRLRMGQFTAPFNRERHPAPTRHLFVERSVANTHFEVPTGRDIGVMAHGVIGERLNLAAGVFSGQGLNQGINRSSGHLFSGRAVVAALGDLRMDEVPAEISDVLHLNLGVGAYYTFQNSAREWNLFGLDPSAEANVLAATADLFLHWNRFVFHLAGFSNSVEPVQATPGFNRYQGAGLTSQVGVLAVEERLLFVGRYSQVFLDTGRDDQLNEVVLGSTFLHRGNSSKLNFEVSRRSRTGLLDRMDDEIRLQYQFLF